MGIRIVVEQLYLLRNNDPITLKYFISIEPILYLIPVVESYLYDLVFILSGGCVRIDTITMPNLSSLDL